MAKESAGGLWILLPVVVVAVVMIISMIIIMSRHPKAASYTFRQPHLPTVLPDPPPSDAQTPTTPPAPDALDISLPPQRAYYTAAAGRSPLLKYNENLKRPIAPTRLDQHDTSSAPALKPGEILPWHQAPRYVGRIATIQGQVLLARNTGKVCFLNFVKQWQGRFYIIIFKDALKGWPQPPEIYFLNKTIRVTGEITTHGTVPQIQVHDPSQITLQ